jgi:putative copper export protein
VNEPYTLLDAAYAAARWGWYLAAFLVLGAGSYAPFLFRHRTRLDATDPDVDSAVARRAARIGLIAALALLGFTAVRLYFQTGSLLEPDAPITGESVRAVLATVWGHGWERQGAMALLATVGFGAATRGSRFGWMVASAAGGGIGISAGMTGHAATEQAGRAGFLLDAAHVWAGGFWLGGLAVMLLAGLPVCRGLPDERRLPMIRALVGDFSRRATFLAPLTIGLGVWLAIRYLGWAWPLHLTETSYGWALLAKLGALAVVGGLGAFHWRMATPRAGSRFDPARFTRTGALEILAGTLLLAATAVLVSLPLPGEHM